MGTLSMVEACRFHIEQKSIDDFRFLHVSTDEVKILACGSTLFTESATIRVHPILQARRRLILLLNRGTGPLDFLASLRTARTILAQAKIKKS